MSTTPCKPSFFLVGAPRSGTTSLDHYLSQHPEVFMGTKDTRFFAPDLSSLRHRRTNEEYPALFQDWNGERRIGESSAFYLYSKLAAVRIKRFAPNAKIIAILRNPVDMVTSLHSYFIITGVEDIKRLEDALEAESDRRQGKRIPRGSKEPKEILLYHEIGNYAEQLERFYCEFRRENVHVIIFDDFRRDTEGEFLKVCDFLGIAMNSRTIFTRENTAKTPRSFMLHRTCHLARHFLRASATWLKPIVPSPLRRQFWRLYDIGMKINLATGSSPIRSETRLALALYYEREVERLEMLLERDLNCWRAENTE